MRLSEVMRRCVSFSVISEVRKVASIKGTDRTVDTLLPWEPKRLKKTSWKIKESVIHALLSACQSCTFSPKDAERNRPDKQRTTLTLTYRSSSKQHSADDIWVGRHSFYDVTSKISSELTMRRGWTHALITALFISRVKYTRRCADKRTEWSRTGSVIRNKNRTRKLRIKWRERSLTKSPRLEGGSKGVRSVSAGRLDGPKSELISFNTARSQPESKSDLLTDDSSV